MTLSPIIMGTNYFLTLLGIFILGSVFKSAWEFPENLIITAVPLLIFLAFRYRDVRRWFPAKAK